MQEGMSPGCEAGRKEQLLREFVQLRHAEDERLTELAKENTFLRQVSGGLSQGALSGGSQKETHSKDSFTHGAYTWGSLTVLIDLYQGEGE